MNFDQHSNVYDNIATALKCENFICSFVYSQYFSLASYLTSMSVISERADGTWYRFIAAGVKPNQFIISHFLEGFIVMIIQFGEYFCYINFMLSPQLSLISTILISLLVFLTGICGLVFGLLMSIVNETVMGSFVVAQFFIYPAIFISGKFTFQI